MNASIISHRLFVAALTNQDHPADKPIRAGRGVELYRPTRNGSTQPAQETLALWTARPRTSWPFGGLLEKRQIS